MNTTTKKAAQHLIEKYFFGQNNDEIVIKKDDMNKFLAEFSQLVISRTLDIAFNMKDYYVKYQLYLYNFIQYILFIWSICRNNNCITSICYGFLWL